MRKYYELDSVMFAYYPNDNLATLIETGLQTNSKETGDVWIEYKRNTYLCCALGLAVVGKYGQAKGYQLFHETFNETGDWLETLARLLPATHEEITLVNDLHCVGMSAENIATLLGGNHVLSTEM